jgi:uncharacterized phage-like protein YoqJ
MNLGITGHRPHKLGGYNEYTNLCWPIQHKMETFFSWKAPERIVSGMALGADQWAVVVALKLGIKVTALIPCKDQDRLWPPAARAMYSALLASIELGGGKIEYVSDKPYDKWCMVNRNKEIVNNASEMLAVWDGTKGGTGNCVKLALNDGLKVTVLDPNTMEFKELERS